ncbi:MAG: hypothetical protein KJ970_08020 [Candidatus Eisenbacteria bacterium]|uniref:Membrane protein 6-pyruvoyl-tetrahydropterin synthase-related domain-containing protein n=1 Tax=Eiseniibacteriota bacterium TaxID=2212470 RepID=A0A948WCF0_UNCEI|nr:hypothetical protein [Candidatus Eisenbacteria bacterium]MBU1949860.1 hypothetical protein [Candidatus Eisenbacteria bacterium]MBU2690863.1 hypothetical protein [Candidatus Eisenbacteria bacterium]
MIRRIGHKIAIAGCLLLAMDFLYLHMAAIPSVKGELSRRFAASGARMLDWTAMARILAPSLIGPVTAGFAVLVILAVFEWRRRSLSGFLFEADRPGSRPILFVSALAAVTGAIYLAPGDMTLGDTGTHLYRAQYFLQEIQQGRLPIWAFQWYMGYPFGLFYSQAANVLLAALTWAFGNLMFSGKMLAFICHFAGGIGIFLFLRAWTGKSLPAVLALFATCILRQNIKIVMLDGRITGALFLAIVPYAFFFAYRLMERPNRRDLAALACALGCLPHAHYGMLAPFLPIWVLYLSVLLYHFASSGNLHAASVRRLAGAHFLGLCLSLSLMLPILIEGDWVNMPRLVTTPVGPPIRDWLNFVRWSPLGQMYQGMILPALALLGVFLGRKTDRLLAVVFLGGACLNYWFWGGENRALSFFAIGLIIPACIAIHRILLLTGPAAGRAGLFILLLILIDQGAFALMNTYTTDANLRSRDYETMAVLSDTLPPAGGRVAEGPLINEQMSFSAWRYYPLSSIPTVVGPFIQGSTISFRYTNAILMKTALSINGTGAVDRPSAEGLALLNVGLILAGDRKGYTKVPAGENLYTERIGEMPGLRLRYTYPALFAKHFAAIPDSVSRLWKGVPGLTLRPGLDPRRYERNEFVLGLIDAMRIDLPNASAASFYHPYGESGNPRDAALYDSGGDPAGSESVHPLECLHHDWTGQKVNLVIRTPDKGFLRLAYAYYPHLLCRVDGLRVPARPDAFGAMVIPISEGEHRIELVPSLSLIRKISNAVSLAVLILLFFFFIPRRTKQTA